MDYALKKKNPQKEQNDQSLWVLTKKLKLNMKTQIHFNLAVWGTSVGNRRWVSVSASLFYTWIDDRTAHVA